MADATKYLPVGGGNVASDFKSLFSLFKTRRSITFAYGFMLAFVLFTVFLAFSPSPNASAPWFANIFTSSQTSSFPSYKSQFPSFFSHLFPNSSRSYNKTSTLSPSSQYKVPTTNPRSSSNNSPPIVNKETSGAKDHILKANQTQNAASPRKILAPPPPHKSNSSVKNHSVKGVASNNYTASLAKKQNNATNTRKKEDELLIKSLMKCDLFDGEWVKDDSYPLYEPGSCTLIDEQFNCIGNGRPDKGYQKYKWKPKGCTLPRYVCQFHEFVAFCNCF